MELVSPSTIPIETEGASPLIKLEQSLEPSSPTQPEALLPHTGSDISPTASTTARRQYFFPRIKNYLPVGCIIPQHVPQANAFKVGWTEVQDASLIHAWLPTNGVGESVDRLLQAQWIRILEGCPFGKWVLRFFVLPDDFGHSRIDRKNEKLRFDLVKVVSHLNTSKGAWKGYAEEDTNTTVKFDLWARPLGNSLFYLFNTLPSPSPSLRRIERCSPKVAVGSFMQDAPIVAAVKNLLTEPPTVTGLTTTLFRYQANSVAAMIEKEVAPKLDMDPRFEPRECPKRRRVYYYCPRERLFMKGCTKIESSRGGILAENMGVGKTIMCLALVLTTKHSLPKIPAEHQRPTKRRSGVGTYLQMLAASANRNSIGIKAEISLYRSDTEYRSIEKACEAEWPIYTIIPQTRRWSTRTKVFDSPLRRLKLCSTTIIVVPQHLIHQWEEEIKRHVSQDDGVLSVLIMPDSKRSRPMKPLPSADVLREFDVILFSKRRFEAEARDGSDGEGRTTLDLGRPCECAYSGSSRIVDCSCVRIDKIYSSPLKELHFLRIIIDEGHEFTSKSSEAVTVATKLVTAERRWVVSGTPAQDRLFEADIALATRDNGGLGLGLANEQIPTSITERRKETLESQKAYSKKDEQNGAARKIGTLLSNFLQVDPWATKQGESKKVEWEDFAFRHESYRAKTYDAFSLCLQSTLCSYVVKTRYDDIEKDVQLPHFDHKTVYLEPSFYDKLTNNLFILFITSNAVTSERSDIDYLFHKSSARDLSRLIHNLRAGNFMWTGWSRTDVEDVIRHSLSYLECEEAGCSEDDRTLLRDCLGAAQMALHSIGWNALSRTHDLGLFVDAWPGSSEHWSMTRLLTPAIIGATTLGSVQKFVNTRLSSDDIADDIADDIVGELQVEGERALAAARKASQDEERSAALSKMKGVPSSVLSDDTSKVTKQTQKNTLTLQQAAAIVDHGTSLEPDSPLAATAIVGTTSRKMSYLLDRIMEFQGEEKILIFYDHDDTAFYIAQCLELMHIKHLIYAHSLDKKKASEYAVAFALDDTVRVLLLDIKVGATGLNLNAASRVFFVNSPCKPHLEAQAIKRAHRIGQKRVVHVETLVLRDTIEEAMFKRSRAMTTDEHKQADKDLLEDQGIAHAIQSARPLPLHHREGQGDEQMAALKFPQQIFGRSGGRDLTIMGIDAAKPSTSSSLKRRDAPTSETSVPKRARVRLVAAARNSRNRLDASPSSSYSPTPRIQTT